MTGGYIPPTARDLPCASCRHDHTWLPCDFCECDHALRIGIDTALGG